MNIEQILTERFPGHTFEKQITFDPQIMKPWAFIVIDKKLGITRYDPEEVMDRSALESDYEVKFIEQICKDVEEYLNDPATI